jgi:hypothetical protein
MTTTETTGQTYYRTAKGSHRHAAWACANSRRSIQLGGVTEIPADEVAGWAPCEDCCDTAAVKAATAVAAVKAAAQCPNTGVLNPKRIQSECRDCGKHGTVNRSTGQLRAHKPAK